MDIDMGVGSWERQQTEAVRVLREQEQKSIMPTMWKESLPDFRPRGHPGPRTFYFPAATSTPSISHFIDTFGTGTTAVNIW